MTPQQTTIGSQGSNMAKQPEIKLSDILMNGSTVHRWKKNCQDIIECWNGDVFLGNVQANRTWFESVFGTNRILG